MAQIPLMAHSCQSLKNKYEMRQSYDINNIKSGILIPQCNKMRTYHKNIARKEESIFLKLFKNLSWRAKTLA